MTTLSRPLRSFLMAVGTLLAISASQASLGSVGNRSFVDLPGVTTALDHDYQVRIEVALRVRDKRNEHLVRESTIPLRHALVLALADQDPQRLDARGIETVLDRFRHDANDLLGGQTAISAVLLKNFVVQGK